MILLKFKCAGVKLIILAFFINKLFVAAAFYNSAVVKHHNNVRVLNGGKSVSNSSKGYG